MKISQDPIVGVYQSSDRFWSRIEQSFNEEKLEHWEVRTKRSMQARIQTIEKATKRLHACIKVVENMHQSGASNKNIVSIHILYNVFFVFHFIIYIKLD